MRVPQEGLHAGGALEEIWGRRLMEVIHRRIAASTYACGRAGNVWRGPCFTQFPMRQLRPTPLCRGQSKTELFAPDRAHPDDRYRAKRYCDIAPPLPRD
jgi:hypothetical protein